jgi:L-amino acid N-acyltransferase YncA
MTDHAVRGEIIVRRATEADAPAMAELLNAIIAKGGTTAHRRPFSTERMVGHYVAAERGIHCAVADAGGAILGFQALDWPSPGWTGANPLAVDWATIATFVAIGAQGRGVGQLLFAATLAAARRAGVRAIDATIRRENAGGLAYYGGLGFRDYRSDETVIARKFEL